MTQVKVVVVVGADVLGRPQPPHNAISFDRGCGPPRTPAPTDSLTFHSRAATNRIGRIYAGCSESTQSQTLDAIASHLDAEIAAMEKKL